MFYNFRTCYSTVSNMRWYGHKCHFRIIIFYSTFSLSSHCFLSLQPMFSLSFFFRSPFVTLKSTAIKPPITDQASPIKPPITDQVVSLFYIRHRSTVWRPHRSMVRHRSTSLSGILIALSPSSISGLWVCAGGCGCGLVDVGLFGSMDVGLCRSL